MSHAIASLTDINECHTGLSYVWTKVAEEMISAFTWNRLALGEDLWCVTALGCSFHHTPTTCAGSDW